MQRDEQAIKDLSGVLVKQAFDSLSEKNDPDLVEDVFDRVFRLFFESKGTFAQMSITHDILDFKYNENRIEFKVDELPPIDNQQAIKEFVEKVLWDLYYRAL